MSVENINSDEKNSENEEKIAPTKEKKTKKKKPKKQKNAVIVGGMPSVNLLPEATIAEYATTRSKKIVVKMISASLVLVLLGAAIPAGLAFEKNLENSSLDKEYDSIIQQQTKYNDVIVLENGINLMKTAQKTVTTGGIDWSSFLDDINSSLPENTLIQSLTIVEPTTTTEDSSTDSSAQSGADSESGQSGDAQSGASANAETASGVTFTATFITDNLDKLAIWKNSLTSINGFESAEFTSATSSDNGTYTVNANLSFNKDIVWDRFNEGDK